MRTHREEEIFLHYLRSRGLRVTSERRALLSAIFAQHGHIDADQVLRAARDGGAKISRATVYRNLELLLDCGLVSRVRLDGQKSVYEHVHPGQQHDHLTCRVCGRIVEFVSPGTSALVGEISRAHGFAPEANRIQILGRCRDCRDESAETLEAASAREGSGA